MHILIAPNAFKNSLNAAAVASAIEEGLKLSRLNCTTECFPIADGGDGTGMLIIKTCNGVTVTKEVTGPLGRKVMAPFGLIDKGRTAVIEMADASGIRLLKKDELDPLRASSYGTGELMRFALDAGATKIILAMGGSATVDAGCGILNALGIVFFNAHGSKLAAAPQTLGLLAVIDVSALDERMGQCEVIILCDVNNKLLGRQGAARVFGPQKGAGPAAVKTLEDFLKRFAVIAAGKSGVDISNTPHGGTAGGAAAGLQAFLNARLVNGIDYFLSLTNFNKALQRADLVITGEGSIDKQTLQGKGPYGVAWLAKKNNVPVIGLAGSIPLKPTDGLQKYFDVLLSINNEACDLQTAMNNTTENLIRTAKTTGDLIALHQLPV